MEQTKPGVNGILEHPKPGQLLKQISSCRTFNFRAIATMLRSNLRLRPGTAKCQSGFVGLVAAFARSHFVLMAIHGPKRLVPPRKSTGAALTWRSGKREAANWVKMAGDWIPAKPRGTNPCGLKRSLDIPGFRQRGLIESGPRFRCTGVLWGLIRRCSPARILQSHLGLRSLLSSFQLRPCGRARSLWHVSSCLAPVWLCSQRSYPWSTCLPCAP